MHGKDGPPRLILKTAGGSESLTNPKPDKPKPAHATDEMSA